MKKIVLLRHGESIWNKENPFTRNFRWDIDCRSWEQPTRDHQIFKKHSGDEIVHLNLPTAVPYIFEFDDNLNFVKDYFLGDPEEIKKLMDTVAHQGKKSK